LLAPGRRPGGLATDYGAVGRFAPESEGQWKTWNVGVRKLAAEQRESVLRKAVSLVTEGPFLHALRPEKFDLVVFPIILLNAATIFAEIDAPGLCYPETWILINILFNCVFTLELVLKYILQGWTKFRRQWFNLFSLLVTVLAWLEISAGLLSLMSSHPRAGRLGDRFRTHFPADLVQLLRLARIIKFAELSKSCQTLLRTVLLSLRSIAWVLVIGALIMYACACFTTIGIGHRDFRGEDGKETPALATLRRNFGSLDQSAYSLFELIVLEGIADNVRPFVDDLQGFEPMVVFLLLFVFVGHFFLLNWLIAIVVNCLLQAHQAEHEHEEKKDAQVLMILANELYETLRERNNFDDEITEAHLKAWIKEGTTSSDILHRIGWSASFVTSTHACCVKDTPGSASLADMRHFWKHANDRLTVAHGIEFLQPCVHRLERMEEVAKAFAQGAELWTLGARA